MTTVHIQHTVLANLLIWYVCIDLNMYVYLLLSWPVCVYLSAAFIFPLNIHFQSGFFFLFLFILYAHFRIPVTMLIVDNDYSKT